MSTLTDAEIEAEARSGRLIAGDFTRVNVHQACYELRMSDVYYDLTEGNRRVQLDRGQKVLIKPLHRVVLITKESLAVPDDIVARIISKGSLFSVGLMPVSTYADPGFNGQIGIVTQNVSDKYIELPVGESIAKIEFSRLTGPVREPYRGQHGFHTQIWPIKTQLQRLYSEVAADKRVDDELTEAYRVTPAATVDLMKYLHRRQNWILGIAALSVISNLVVLTASTGKFVDGVVALLINIVSAAIIGGVVLLYRAPWEKSGEH